MAAARRHIVIVEALDAFVDLTSDDPEERVMAQALGLPCDAIADRLECDVTVIGWDEWSAYATVAGSFLGWLPYPATRAVVALAAPAERSSSARVSVRQMPARDPASSRPLVEGASPPSLGLLADSDPLFFASYCLNLELRDLHRRRPISLLILPMWGGLAYLPLLTRATGVEPLVDTPMAIVVTDSSANKQIANEEGFWTRPGVTRRQMEDLSLALADVVLTFGARGDELARKGRLPEAAPAVRAPRHVPAHVLDGIARAADRGPAYAARQLFLHEPQEASSGVLATLDAVRLLGERDAVPERAVLSSGPDMRFAPMQPRTFTEYWSSRGFVKALVAARRWAWSAERPDVTQILPVRLYPSLFDHLPAVWPELARGSLVLLSDAAAEGLLPCGSVPGELRIGKASTPADVADAIERVGRAPLSDLERWRRELCSLVVSTHGSQCSLDLLDGFLGALATAMRTPPPLQDLSRAARLLLDRSVPLGLVDDAARSVASGRPRVETTGPAVSSPGTLPTLSVVVTCYELGATIRETIESVWASTRMPDELILVDDGSTQAETLAEIDALQKLAERRGVPLQVVRQTNRGLSLARNAGLYHARGDLVSFLDGDDLVEPDFYALATDLLARYPTLGGVACWAYLFGDGVPDMFWNAPQPELPLLLVENTVVVPCVMRADPLRAFGAYDPSLRYNYEDWEVSIAMLSHGHPIVTLPAFLHRYRVRPDSLFRSMTVAQHQRMREVLFAKHAASVTRFAVEVSMLLEQERGKALYAPKP